MRYQANGSDEWEWKELNDDSYAGNHPNRSNFSGEIQDNELLIIHRQAGKFEYRVNVNLNASVPVIETLPVQVEVFFPKYDQIIADQGVKDLADAKWQRTLNDASENPNQVRERGAWVWLNTEGLGKYEFENVDPGPWAHPDSGAYISFPDVTITQLYDRPKAWFTTHPKTTEGTSYLVAMFHTHPPNAYGSKPNFVGPSTEDKDTANLFKIVGLVYDYISTLGNWENVTGQIPPGHPLNSPKRFYPAGPDRRVRNAFNPNN